MRRFRDGAESDHDAVAEKFIDYAAMRFCDWQDLAMQAGQHRYDALRRDTLGKSREAPNVEHDYGRVAFGRRASLHVVFDAGNGIRDVASEEAPHALGRSLLIDGR